MGTLRSLAARLYDEADKIEDTGNELAIGAARVVLRSLVYETPVDTSTALSNWQVSLNLQVSEERGPFFDGIFGSTRRASAEAAIAQGEAMLARKVPGDDIYISNVVEYILRLNAGSSAQSPGAFVEAAVVLGRNYVQEQTRG